MVQPHITTKKYAAHSTALLPHMRLIYALFRILQLQLFIPASPAILQTLQPSSMVIAFSPVFGETVEVLLPAFL